MSKAKLVGILERETRVVEVPETTSDGFKTYRPPKEQGIFVRNSGRMPIVNQEGIFYLLSTEPIDRLENQTNRAYVLFCGNCPVENLRTLMPEGKIINELLDSPESASKYDFEKMYRNSI